MTKTVKRNRRRVNAKGRNDTEQYIPIPYTMARSIAFRSLSGPELKVWIELRSRFNGRNNGELSLSLDEGARLLSMSKTTVYRAFGGLEDKGFIVMTRRGKWYGRLATTWAVTDRGYKGYSPTNAWKDWRPSDSGLIKKRKTVPRYRDGPYAALDGST